MRLANVRYAATLVLLGSIVVQAESQTAFPEVAMVNGSHPRFTTLALDETGENSVFLLLDGTPEAEYRRAYIWIPGHANYGRPVAMARGADNAFPPLTVPVQDQPGVETTWQIRAWVDVREHGAREAGQRTVSRFNYATGETESHVEKWEARPAGTTRSPHFAFRVRYRHAGRHARSLASSSDALDVTIDGALPSHTDWNRRPAPFTPWHDLYFRFNVTEDRIESERDHGNLVFRTSIGYDRHQHGRVQFANIPDSANIELDVFRYLEEPLYAEAIPPVRLLSGNHPVTVPFGWYQFNARFVCEGLRVHPFERSLFPFTRL